MSAGSGYVCPECGLAYDPISPSDAIAAIRSYPRRFREALAPLDDERHEALLRRRPDATTWSALEYAAHVADLLGAMAGVFERILAEQQPTITMFDPDQRASEAAYGQRDPREVLDELATNAERAAGALGGASADDWSRTGRFDWGERDLLAMARNAVHEGSHHLRDVERVLAEVRSRPD